MIGYSFLAIVALAGLTSAKPQHYQGYAPSPAPSPYAPPAHSPYAPPAYAPPAHEAAAAPSSYAPKGHCPEPYGVQTYPHEQYCDKFFKVSISHTRTNVKYANCQRHFSINANISIFATLKNFLNGT